MLSVEEALARVLADLGRIESEIISLEDGFNRFLAEGVAAHITQPPFDASAMDGYAVQASDLNEVPCDLRVIGDAAAGHPFEGDVGAGQAVRIFTGGAVPDGADTIVIQEVTQREADTVTVKERAGHG